MVCQCYQQPIEVYLPLGTKISWGQVYIVALCIDEEKIKIIEGKKETVQ